MAFVQTLEKIILLWLQMFLANASLFSVDVAEVVEGVLRERQLRNGFICITDRYQSRTPSSRDKQTLKEIKLDLEDNEHDVLEKITCGDKGHDGEIKGFPQLRHEED